MSAVNIILCFLLSKDSWQSVLDIINYNGDHQDEIIPYVRPGHFNDMDMVNLFKKKLGSIDG